jgi:hypothetical protein
MNRLTWKPSLAGDILVAGTASWFGGANDPDDDGSTASGLSTKDNPGIMGCALPFAVSNGRAVPNCFGSPIPSMPYKTTMVEVSAGGKTITIPVIDCGPALSENRPIDLTVAAFLALGGDLNEGLMLVSFRIVGGAKYVTP